jgi:hypothetical protein
MKRLLDSLIFIFFLLWHSSFSFLARESAGGHINGAMNSSCAQKHAKDNRHILDLYWINLDRSPQRKEYMHRVFKFFGLHSNRRFSAITPDDLTIPKGFEKATDCKFLNENQTNEEIIRIKTLQANHQMNRTVLVATHCGKQKNNFQYRHLANVLSHLVAIYQASHHHSHKKYALIMEDDLRMAMEVDFEKVIESAPQDFGMLQLVTSNEVSIEYAWSRYLADRTKWLKRGEFDASWCAGAYIIHKERMRPVISQIIQKVSEKLYVAKVQAVDKRCPQDQCCTEPRTLPKAPCVVAPYGYESDNFIYNLLFDRSYVSCIPMFLTSDVADVSSMHQEHVVTHQSAFAMIKNLVQYMLITDRKLLPSYFNPTCAEECHHMGVYCLNSTTSTPPASTA